MNLTYDGGDTKVQSLVDQLNAHVGAIGIPPNGAYPSSVPPFTTSLQSVENGIVLNQSDSTRKFGQGVFIPNDIPPDIATIIGSLPAGVFLYKGLTTTTSPPSTTDLPADGDWGWHLNTTDDSFWWAYNKAGAIRVPTGPPTAIIIQRENNGRDGGSAHGYQDLSATPNEAVATFYGRRLTDMPTNYMNAVVPGSFVQSTGGGASVNPSTEGTWDLAIGVYLVSFEGVYNLGFASGATSMMGGLFNKTAAAFETHMGPDAIPVLFNPLFDDGNADRNFTATFQAVISVTVQSTYAIRHQGDSTASLRNLNFCGAHYAHTNAQVNGAAPTQQFCTIRITKLA